LQGGRFGNGFVSAGASAVLSPIPEVAAEGAAGQTVIAAVIGGTVSELSGGKFANGAITAAFQFAVGRGLAADSGGERGADSFAEEISGEVSVTGCQDSSGCYSFAEGWRDSLPEYLRPEIDAGVSQAAVDVLTPLRLGRTYEWVGYIHISGPTGAYAATEPLKVYTQQVGNAQQAKFKIARYAVAIYHAHQQYAQARANLPLNSFGPGDHSVLYTHGISNYLMGPNRAISVLQMTILGPLPNVIRPGQ